MVNDDLIQSAIDHIKTAVDVDPWAADMAEKALKKQIPMKWEYDRRVHWKCPNCHIVMGLAAKYIYKYCYNCGQKCERMDKYDDAE